MNDTSTNQVAELESEGIEMTITPPPAPPVIVTPASLSLTPDQMFPDIVGQSGPKKVLGFYRESYLHTKVVPNIIFIAPKGNGKTTLAREFAKNLVQFDEEGNVVMKPDGITTKKKTFVEINCSTLKSIKQFINGFIVPYVLDKDVTILFDEASEIPHDISMALLTILNPNQSKTTFTLDEFVCDFDFSKQTFLFATSEAQGVFHALLDRLTRIDLESYTIPQLAAILQKGSKDVVYENDALLQDMATVTRGNARNAQKLASDVKTYLQGDTTFTHTDWADLKDILTIQPLGLSPMEIGILRFLHDSPDGTSLTCLSAKTGMSRESLQKDGEIYLQRHGLLEIAAGKGRMLTAKGFAYLKALDGKVTAPAVVI